MGGATGVYPNNLKQRLQAGEVVLGTSLEGRDIYVAAATFATGPDWVWIDQEHSRMASSRSA